MNTLDITIRIFIYGAGMHGCLYQDGPYFAAKAADAVEAMAKAYNIGRTRKAELRRNGYLELSLKRHGNEFCQYTIVIANATWDADRGAWLVFCAWGGEVHLARLGQDAKPSEIAEALVQLINES